MNGPGVLWQHFAYAIRKYGPEAFDHTILETCETIDEANTAEDAWIDSFSARDPKFGFNLIRGGAAHPHDTHDNPWARPEYRAKIMAFKAGPRKKGPDGYYFSPAARQRRSVTLKEIASRPEVKAKHAASMVELWADPERRPIKKTGSQYIGVHYSKEPGRTLRWSARAKDGGKDVHLGYFATEAEAAQAVTDYRLMGARYSGRTVTARDPLTANILRAARKAAGVTLKLVAERVGLTIATVHDHEHAVCGSTTEYLARALSACWPEQDFSA